MKYISDVLLDIYIKKTVYDSTQSLVFEPNDPNTWTRISTLVQSFLDNLWMNGALQGSTSKEAYYVKCDADLNTAEMREAGQILCEVGYANKKPAEFVVFRFSHQVASN
jgi:phage tail sheath protein FI